MTLEKLYNYVLEKQEELKPCPFCGSFAYLNVHKSRKGYTCNIQCNSCLVSMDNIVFDTLEEAIDEVVNNWNKRT